MASSPARSRTCSTAPRSLSTVSRPSRPEAQSVAALHHLDAAAGGILQARLQRLAHHAGGAEALRGHRYRRRDRRSDHLYAYRRRADGARSDRPKRARRSATRFGERYVPEKPRHYSTKAKNAQEAHEAIRPTGFERAPDDLKKYLDADQLKLYDLIWKRATASQMASAEIERTTVEITASKDGKTAGCAPPVRSSASTASLPPIPTPRKTANSRTETAMTMHGCPRSMPGKPWPGRRSTPPSTSPSRRRAIRKPR
jgi:hypothetical protein